MTLSKRTVGISVTDKSPSDCFLNRPYQDSGDEAHGKEEKSDKGDRLGIAEGFRAHDLCRLHEFENRNGRQQRRFLEKRHEIIAKCRNDGRNGLRNDDVPERCPRAEIERNRCFPLAAVNIVETGPVNLRAIGGVVDTQGQYARRKGIEHDAETGNTK